jgi:drug/metabolite transporter (DMT)-like permease
MLIAMILVSVALAAAAQLTLKSGMNQVTAEHGTVTLSAASFRAIATEPNVWAGFALFGLSAVMWIFVLSRTSLSFAYPFVALTYLLIALVDVFVLHEDVPPLRWVGLGLIMAGILVIARTAPS